MTTAITILGLLAILPTPSVTEPTPSITAMYTQSAERIITATLAGNDAWAKLEHLCLKIGHRLSGSPSLDRAIDWAAQALRDDGQANVHRQEVMVPHWVRGRESVTMLEPHFDELHMLGLGGSVGTSPDGVTATVIVANNEDHLNALGDAVRGKIVLFNKRMPAYDPINGSGYGTTVTYRVHGARWASEKGAVAALVRSVTANSLSTPHTGGMRYGDAKVKIPAAAVTTEDADSIARLTEMGVPVVLNLKMEAKTLPDARSANVIAELRGLSLPDEIVVIGGHLDSWDVGQGAHDDGAGCVTAMEAIHVLRKLGMFPRRTIRVVLWTNEENGLRGAGAYAKNVGSALANHVAGIESDSGAFRPLGYSVQCSNAERGERAVEQMNEILELCEGLLGPLDAKKGGGGADLRPLREGDMVLMSQRVHGDTYFAYHHTWADTIDKVDPDLLSRNVAMLAAAAFVIADLPWRLGDAPHDQ